MNGLVARLAKLGLFVSALWLSAVQAQVLSPGVWVHDGATLRHLDAQSQLQLASTAAPTAVRGIAADVGGGVWVVSTSGLSRYDSSAVLRATVALQMGNHAPLMAVDPVDGSLWLAYADSTTTPSAPWRLVHFGLDGVELSRTALGQLNSPQTSGLFVDRARHVVLVSGWSLLRLNSSGVEVSRRQLNRPDAVRTELDGFAGVFWYATSAANGPSAACQLNRVDAFNPTQPEIGVAPCPRSAISLDQLTGDLWYTHGTPGNVSLTRMAASGTLLANQTLPIDASAFLARDYRTGKLWVRGDQALEVFDRQGLKVATLPFKPTFLTIPPLKVSTKLELITPAAQSTLNVTPSFVLQLRTECNGTSCEMAQERRGDLAITADLDGAPVGTLFGLDSSTGRATFTPSTPLIDGPHTFSAYVVDRFGQKSNVVESRFVVDTQGPIFSQVTPPNGSRFSEPAILIGGRLNEPATINLGAATASGVSFSFPVTLSPGSNAYQILAVDGAGNSTQANLIYHYLTLAVNAPANGATVGAANVTVTGNYTGPDDSTVEINGRAATLSGGGFSAAVPLVSGANVLTVTLRSGGVSVTRTVTVIRKIDLGSTLDAPPVDPTVPSVLAEITGFLYSGSNPVQIGVAAGTIEAKRAAVVRGRVLSRDGQALQGVKVSIKGQIRYGYTQSRADGQFDMAVNGGDTLVVDYEKPGYLPAQRTINPQWQQWAVLDDVALVALDPQVTAVNLSVGSNSIQVAQGSSVSDADGVRRATVLFPPGTTAELVLPDGSRQPLSSAQFRATEYTVGPNGPKAMPAPLPPTSGYTYAVELSFDEAIAARAKGVRFNQKLPVYVENFLNFPVGGIVPLGYYDPEKSAWIPSENGRVIKVLAVNAGVADVDGDGDGLADGPEQLAQLAITEAERERLGALFAAGQSLWRVQVDHFTTFDHNWPFGPPPDARQPKLPKNDSKPCDKPECEEGSIIDAQNRALGERVPVVGTGFDLNYRSNRVPGFKSNEVNIPLSSNDLPASVLRIELTVSIAGRTFSKSFLPQQNQSYLFNWDGLDAYGRFLHGGQRANIKVGYVYRGTYRPPGRSVVAFADLPSSVQSIIDATARDVTLWQETAVELGAADARMSGIGGWTLGVHHMYDLNERRLFLGSGTQRSVSAVDSSLVQTIAGNGDSFIGEFGPAIETSIGTATGVAADGDGGFFIVSQSARRIFKVTAAGVLTPVAGNGQPGFTGEGGPATAAAIGSPWAIATDGAGTVFFSSREVHRVFRVGPDGILHVHAGSGSSVSSGDGGQAKEAGLNWPTGIALDPHGNLFVAEEWGHRVRRIGPDGVISTVAGTGTEGFSGDGGLATQAQLYVPVTVAVDASGALFIADAGNGRIRKVSPDGRISTFAGAGRGSAVLGRQATASPLRNVIALTLDTNGTLYLAENGTSRVLSIASDGIIRGVAGYSLLPNLRDIYGYYPDDQNWSAAATLISSPSGLSVDPEGNLLIADRGRNRIKKVRAPFPGYSGGEIKVVSEDGATQYEFEQTGRHLRTRDIRTNNVLLSFGYTSAGLLSAITDADGNVTMIERDGSGRAQAIVAPFGQRTTLGYDSNGWLNRIANPLNEAFTAEYSADGLMSAFRSPKGHTSILKYDGTGRLERDENAEGGFWAINRTEIPGGYRVQMSTAEGRTTTRELQRLDNGDERRQTQYPDGRVSQTLMGVNGVTTTTAPDGTVVSETRTSDPLFGRHSPMTNTLVTVLPSGKRLQVRTASSLDFEVPQSRLNLLEEWTNVTINDSRSYSTRYTPASRETHVSTPENRNALTRTDEKGRVVFSQVGDLAPTEVEYDDKGRVRQVQQGQGAEQRRLNYAYATDGTLLSVTDLLNQSIVYQRDAVGRPTQTTLPGDRVLGASFDANGNLDSLTPPGRAAHGFEHNKVDLATTYTPPSLPGVADAATHYSYNRDKDLTQVWRADGTIIDFAYLPSGKLGGVTPSAGRGQPVTFGYQPGTGLLSSLGNTESTLSYGYDGALLKTEQLSAVGGAVNATLVRGYDSDFHVNELSLNGQAVAFGYDLDKLLTSAGALSLTRSPSHGGITATSLGALSTSQDYNTLGELKTFSANHSGNSLYSYSLEYDGSGRVKAKTEVVTGVSTRYDYGYDSAGRLESVKRNGNPEASWQYDTNGNRTHVNGALVATHDAQDRLLTHGTVSYGYSDHGDLRSKTQAGATTQYQYDAFGNLRQVQLPGDLQIDYLVDSRNRRIGKKVNGTLVQGFVWQDQLRIAAQLDGQGQTVARYVYAEKPNVPEYMVKGGVNYRLLTDHLGSVRLVVNSQTGDIAQRIDYDAWGQVLSDSNPGFQPFGFAGGLMDQHTGLVRFGARDYDSAAGRWTAKDPIGFEGGGANVYAYVDAMPTTLVDPKGEFGVPGAIGGAGFNFAVQLAMNYFLGDGNLGAAAKCVDFRKVLTSAAAGFAGPTLIGNKILPAVGRFFGKSIGQEWSGSSIAATVGAGTAMNALTSISDTPPVHFPSADECECQNIRANIKRKAGNIGNVLSGLFL